MSAPALAVVGGTSEQALSPSATLTAAAANTVLQGGLSMGESLSPLPTKVVEKIVQLKYVEMSELLPETWQVQTDVTLIQSALGLAPGLRRRKGPVTDILQWVQCFATLASVLASAYPPKVPELMAYLATIVKCRQEFEGPAWVLYDRAYRRQAEVSRDLNWSRVNPSLFNLCFTGRARRRLLCHVCLSEGHGAKQCPEMYPQWPMLPFSTQLQAPLQAPPQSVVGQRRSFPPRASSNPQQELCRLFNAKAGNKCTFHPCRYRHICSSCNRGGHGAGACSIIPPVQRKKAREE